MQSVQSSTLSIKISPHEVHDLRIPSSFQVKIVKQRPCEHIYMQVLAPAWQIIKRKMYPRKDERHIWGCSFILPPEGILPIWDTVMNYVVQWGPLLATES